MNCWYCYWGWSKPVWEIYDRARKEIDGILDKYAGDEWPEPRDGEEALDFGPAHVVWSDENWDLTEECLADCDQPQFAGWATGVMEVVRRSLRELAALSQNIREPEPADYDGKQPANFPPAPGIEMVRKRERIPQ